MFKRKVYESLLYWKNTFDGKYAVLLEGARRVGKTTIALNFASNEYTSYICVDFSKVSNSVLEIFNDINDLDLFFNRLQLEYKTTLINRQSVIIFDEIQLFPKARQAIKHLVSDGRYDYIETGSLISIKKNVRNILIPSEEYRINVYPMDFEEFNLAINNNAFSVLKDLYSTNKPIGVNINRKLMRDFRIYLAVGGMPQAVDAYVNKKNFIEIDLIKRNIINLYIDDFKKIDSSGKIGLLYSSIHTQLLNSNKKFFISKSLNANTNDKDYERLAELLDSKTVLICNNITEPNTSLSSVKKINDFKLYYSDVGLFTTMLFNDESLIYEDIYKKLLSDKLDINMGYLYENAVAQIIKSTNRDLYYYTWNKENSTHYYEIDFLITNKTKLIAFEVKSGQIKYHKSIDEFQIKHSRVIDKCIVLSHYDVKNDKELLFKPLYFLPFILES